MMKWRLLGKRTARWWTIYLLGFAFGLFGLQRVAVAQWATSGDDIYNTNSGNVGVGTTSSILVPERPHTPTV